MPASVETVEAFTDSMADLKAPATVRRYVYSITKLHAGAGAAGPTTDANRTLPLAHSISPQTHARGEGKEAKNGFKA